MTPSPRNNDKKSIAVIAMEIINRENLFAFAQISRELKVTQASKDLKELSSDRISEEEVIGRPLAEIFYEFVGAENALQEVLNGAAREYRLEKINRIQADGSTVYLNFKILPFEEGQPGQGLILIIEDATHNSQLERAVVQERNELRLARAQLARANTELLKLSRLKSLFLSIAAHDLRAPLSAIRGYAELLSSGLSEELTQEQQEFLDFISSEVDLLDRLITDFLDLDLIEQGKLVMNVQTCDLNAIVRAVSGHMVELATQKQIRLTTQTPEQASWVMADPQRVRQMIYNLVSNAIKYTPEHGRIEILTRSDAAYGSVEVRDNGQGISPEGMANLFELYHRTDEARRSKVRGTGLGLYIVKSLVDAHQGTITVASQPGGGTSFTVELPAAKALLQK